MGANLWIMPILFIDNYDSFTYNLLQILEENSDMEISLLKNDRLREVDIERADAILVSPGPGIPKDIPHVRKMLEKYICQKKVLGICLGHQLIFEVFGGRLRHSGRIMHGESSPMEVTNRESDMFQGISSPFQGGRYHSWVCDEKTLPGDMCITAVDDRGNIMAIAHKEYKLRGLQFHPESIMTPDGIQMIRNWLDL